MNQEIEENIEAIREAFLRIAANKDLAAEGGIEVYDYLNNISRWVETGLLRLENLEKRIER